MQINLESIKNIKNGTNVIREIRNGEIKIWPKWPIVLYENGNYYTVNGIVNNQYDTDLINTKHNIDCVLGNIKSNYKTGLYRTNDLTLEMCFTSVNSGGRTFFGNNRNDTGYSARWFTAGSNTLYFDYRSERQTSYNSAHRISISYNNDTGWYNGQTSQKYIYRAGYDTSTGRKFIRMKTIESQTWNLVDYSPSSTSYPAPEASQTTDEELIIGNRNSSDMLKMYYMALFNSEETCLGFWYFKWNGQKYRMYDEITGNYLSTSTGWNQTKDTYDSTNTVTYEIESYDGPAPYIIDGTIVDSTGTYDRLYCSKTGIELKGLKLS